MYLEFFFSNSLNIPIKYPYKYSILHVVKYKHKHQK